MLMDSVGLYGSKATLKKKKKKKKKEEEKATKSHVLCFRLFRVMMMK